MFSIVVSHKRITVLALGLSLAVLVTGFSMLARSPEPQTRRVLPDDRAVYEQLRDAEDRWLREHSLEPAGDPVEMAHRRDAITAGLTRLATTISFTIEQVDCRSRTCLARLLWVDHRTAQTRYRALLHFPLDPPCARAVLLRETTGPAEGYRVNLRLTC